VGDLPGGDFDSVTNDVSDDGLTVVGFSKSDFGTEAVRWTAEGGLVALSSLTGEAVPTIARAVSNSGAIAGQLDFTEEQCDVEATVVPSAAVWTEEFGFVEIGGMASYAHDVSADGKAVTGTTCEFFVDEETGDPFDVQRPYHWTEETGLFVLQHRGEAFGISADGNVITGFAPVRGSDGLFSNQAIRWKPDQEDPNFAEVLGLIEGSELPTVSEAYDISADGQVIVGAYRPAGEGTIVEGFRWTEETGFVGLGHLADFNSFVFDVSDDGSVIVGEQWQDEMGEVVTATIWDSVNGLRDLKAVLSEDAELATQLEGWTLIRGNGISADGRVIVGFGTNPDGNQEGWVIQLDEGPPPSLTGDYNNNATVEQGDLDLVLLNWGADAATPPANWTNNLPGGNIDQDELDGVLLNWGNTAAPLGATAGVPEPATLLGAIIGVVALAARRRPFGKGMVRSRFKLSLCAPNEDMWIA
jgi:uncharacterized membrane protein